jgi:hypothetical protein
MRSLAALTSFCASAALLTGCSAIHAAQQSAAASFNSSFHSSFRSSFKTSFIKACSGQGAGEKLCTCVEGKVEAQNTDDQLMKMSADSPATSKMLADDGRACAAGK